MEWLLLQRSNGLRGTRERERERLDVVVDERRVKFETSSRRVGRQTERIVIPADGWRGGSINGGLNREGVGSESG